MGNWMSRKQKYDTETYEGWDKKMQAILNSIEKSTATQKEYERRHHLLHRMVILLSVLLVLSLSIFLFYNYHIVLRYYWYWIICLFMIILLYAFRKVNGVLLKKVNQSLSDLESERVGLLNTLVHVKACLPDITQLMVKYNIDSRYFNTAEVENRNKVIQQLLAVIRGLIELPLCKDCRYYTKEERDKVLSSVPVIYRSLFDHVEPKHAEDIAKPIDEKIMKLMGESEEGDIVVNKVLLLNNEPQEEKEDDHVKIEEIDEKDSKEEEEEEGARRRNV
ncbi:hypothetical protein WA588_004197, partial [Blastocystis sp. NMH]